MKSEGNGHTFRVTVTRRVTQGANKGDTYLFLRQTDETNVLQAHRTCQEKWNMLPTYSLMSQVTPTQKLSPEIPFVTLSVSLKWWWKCDGLHKSRKYEFTVWLFHFSVIHAPSLSYIHNVCTITLYNYIYYVYVHICTGHQRYVSCHSSVLTCPLKTWPSKKKMAGFHHPIHHPSHYHH